MYFTLCLAIYTTKSSLTKEVVHFAPSKLFSTSTVQPCLGCSLLQMFTLVSISAYVQGSCACVQIMQNNNNKKTGIFVADFQMERL